MTKPDWDAMSDKEFLETIDGIACAATPGPWAWEQAGPDGTVEGVDPDDPDMRHVAAANPANVRRLVRLGMKGLQDRTGNMGSEAEIAR